MPDITEVTDVPAFPFGLEAARGTIPGITTLNKFGTSPTGIQTTGTDIWSRADATPTQQTWVAPTQARIHSIVSSAAADDGDPAGNGARTIRIYGLTSWSTAETSEVVTLNGTGAVNTTNAYVIIHRMKVLTSGSTGPNVGAITATAATDNTVTAVIMPGDGQTEMAIYGVPSVQDFYLTRWACNIDKAQATAVSTDFELRVNENPTANLTAFLRKQDMSLQSDGASIAQFTFDPPIKFAGPCIIKVRASSTAADTDGETQFDGYLITK